MADEDNAELLALQRIDETCTQLQQQVRAARDGLCLSGRPGLGPRGCWGRGLEDCFFGNLSASTRSLCHFPGDILSTRTDANPATPPLCRLYPGQLPRGVGVHGKRSRPEAGELGWAESGGGPFTPTTVVLSHNSLHLVLQHFFGADSEEVWRACKVVGGEFTNWSGRRYGMGCLPWLGSVTCPTHHWSLTRAIPPHPS